MLSACIGETGREPNDSNTNHNANVIGEGSFAGDVGATRSSKSTRARIDELVCRQLESKTSSSESRVDGP
eukprot:6496383-Pyramimonas_sp.AAC.1